MDFIRQQLVLIQERLAGLSPSQKMLTAALVVIMVMTMLYWGRFASDRDMVAVMPGTMTGEETAAVIAALGSRGIAFDASSGTVKVAADKQADAIAAISFESALPSSSGNTPSAFDAVLEKLSPMDTQATSTARLKSGREARLQQVIQRWPDIRSAIVVITEAERGGLVQNDPRVSVDIMTKGGGSKSKIANAACSFVLNAVSGLDREHITINVDTTPMINSGAVVGEAGGGNSVQDLRAKSQAEAEAHIRSYFNIPNLSVSVAVDVDAKSVLEKTNTFDPKSSVSMTKNSVTDTTQTVDAAPQNEPGVIPNVGGLDARAAGGAASSGSKTEHTEETNEVGLGTKYIETNIPAGAVKYLSVTLRVPRSYFVAAYRGLNRKVVEPGEEQIAAFVEAQLTQMKADVRRQYTVDESMVNATDYYDVDPYNDPANPVAVASATSGLGLLFTGHAKEVSVGALALTSLFMVSRMVKRSAPPAPEPLLTLDDMPNINGGGTLKSGGKGSKSLNGGFDIAGEVMEGGSIMMGQELDEEVLETSQMVEQVTGFVKDHPDSAAQLIKRWMNHA